MGGGASSAPWSAGGGTAITVRAGDTIGAIAARTGPYPAAAWSVPSGDIDLIWPGQVVCYNGGGSTATVGNASPTGRHVTVRRGDTLSGIAARLGIQWTQLHGYRSGNPSLIYPGETLVLLAQCPARGRDLARLHKTKMLSPMPRSRGLITERKPS
ncbi:LysM peptidoglycan-binding domain-containing protein [Bifidobacterium catenulatum]|uniref:LysM peptidoglycan-binding domain-containing protein n=1 Tax=Bifidobacterium catenulatum TaxID=1686 RepID=UPI003D345941